MSQRIVVVGSVNADLRVTVERHPRPGETLLGGDGTVTPGGKGANQALAAARAGGNVTMIGAVGHDPNAAAALDLLRGSGADLSGIAEVDGPTGVAVVMVAASGENEIVYIPGANATVGADAVASHAELLGQAAVVLCQGETPADGIARAQALAGGRLVLNPAPVIELPPEVITAADPLIVNEHEGALVARMLDPDADVAALEEDPGGCVRALRAAGCRSVVMTLGSAGALVAEGDDVTAIPAVRVDAVDTTGAGDAFAGALSARLAEGGTLLEACGYAARFAALTVTRTGAQASFPSAEEVAGLRGEGR
ncbi:putative ribokinase protein [Acidipropionibacterium acidipropionici ATCC 4875]|uniref:Ribokinase n=1 Tax=Acidipropionibacterium acidipropionici (strain ATCC 4875 / DSM 20272 / JCM 6432 / NBRC 12425 / NCIMB 8070 / 4) TaxID=1171373 RepID=K7RNN5_ACIA4|nr:ribokinase [Acidipropionibacterium acidipropionici]AFV87871.1 putative ribokinase protein [Acidipropionibacterium acidipropionici ATCC 4875]